MELSALIVVIVGTLLFFGFAMWMGFYSRRKAENEQAQNGQAENTGGQQSIQRQQYGRS